MDFTVENAGTTIACREYAGPDASSDAPALVCVHGACVDGVFFDAIARELACDYRVIVYDRRGCGESGDAADGRYDLAAQAAVKTVSLAAGISVAVNEIGTATGLGSVKALIDDATVTLGGGDSEPFMGMRGTDSSQEYSESMADVIDEEVAELIHTAHQVAFDVLMENRDVLDELVR